MSRAGTTFTIALVALLSSAIARPSAAQAERPLLERPRIASDTTVEYPAGAHGDASVVLELVIDPEGNVKDLTVVSGEPPFSDVAKARAWRWRFEPAKRNRKPVAARIRFEVRFKEPPPAPPPEAGAPPVAEGETPAEAPKRPVRARVEEQVEVTVYGDKPPPSARTLTRAEVRELPGAFGDPFRAIEAMPGVTPIISGVPFFYVRGAPPGNVGYFLDGIRVPLLYHIGLGPSVIHPAIVERVDLYPGAYPARYGRFAGGIVAGETTPPRPELHGEASVRLIDSGALVEAPFAGGRGTALVGGRYSYTGLLFSLLNPEAVLEYWDYQARIAYDIGSHDSLSAFAFGAYDFLGEKKDDGTTQTVLGTEFHRIDLRWDHAASDKTTTRLAVTTGFDRTRAGQDQRFFVRDRMIALRSEIKNRPDRKTLVALGSDVAIDYYDVQPPPFDPENPEDRERFDRFFSTRTDLASGIWGELTLEVEPGVTLIPGIRTDLYASNGAAAIGIDPRITARFAVTPKWRLIHTLGLAHQAPSFVVPIPGFQVAGLRGGLQESVQSSAGVEVDLPESFTGSLTLFQNAFFNMTDAIGTGRTEGSDADRLETRSIGSAVGAELLVKRSLTRKLGGYFAYTLSQSLRAVGREKFPSAFDRTHVLNLALAYDLGRRWRAGTRLLFYSGFPAEEATNGQLRSRHPARVSPFYRVDVRLEKKWRLGERGYWALVFEVLNATLSKEVVDVSCDPNGSCRQQEIGPITIPSIGVEAAF